MTVGTMRVGTLHLIPEKGELKGSSLRKHKEGQKQPAKETTWLKKRRLL